MGGSNHEPEGVGARTGCFARQVQASAKASDPQTNGWVHSWQDFMKRTEENKWSWWALLRYGRSVQPDSRLPTGPAALRAAEAC